MILISEKKKNYEKEVEERLRRKSTEDFQTRNERSRKKSGLILSGIGGTFYLIGGFLLFGAGMGFGPLSTPYLIVGIISLVGTLIGAIETKIGGVIILISIPIAIVIGLIISASSFYTIYVMFFMILLGALPPFLPGLFVIIGGKRCLQSSISDIKQVETITT